MSNRLWPCSECAAWPANIPFPNESNKKPDNSDSLVAPLGAVGFWRRSQAGTEARFGLHSDGQDIDNQRRTDKNRNDAGQPRDSGRILSRRGRASSRRRRHNRPRRRPLADTAPARHTVVRLGALHPAADTVYRRGRHDCLRDSRSQSRSCRRRLAERHPRLCPRLRRRLEMV